MPRPRSYVRDDVIDAAKETFWTKGYASTGVSTLERSTGCSRSSLYLEFGSKHRLFQVALARYLDTFIDGLLRPMEVPGAGLAAIRDFFANVKAGFLEDQLAARRGCLMVNSIAELAGRQRVLGRQGASYLKRLHGAFTSSLLAASARGETEEPAIAQRADMLTACTLGIWLSARIDAARAASLCDAIISDVESWGRP
jgi:TetR/AcrR family transcriptional regulator, transcriptional repressor for nem operon